MAKQFTDQDLLDIVDKMPADQKGCSVHTAEDGTGTVDLRNFIINFGRTLLEEVENNKRKVTKKRNAKEEAN